MKRFTLATLAVLLVVAVVGFAWSKSPVVDTACSKEKKSKSKEEKQHMRHATELQ